MRREMQAEGYDGLAAYHVGVPFRIVMFRDELRLNPRITARGAQHFCHLDTPLGPRRKIVAYSNVSFEHETTSGGVSTGFVRGREACLFTDLLNP